MRTHLDLFSGIGGFALAAKWAGFQTIGFCEYEDYPSRVLSARFPGVPIHGDIRELDGEQYRGVTLITGGFPCQPFSVAGKQAGKADDRYLWPEMLRVIAQAQPDWVVAENVTGIVTLALDQVLSDLEGEGYSCGTVVLPACSVDAPHRRDRVWIIAAQNDADTTSERPHRAQFNEQREAEPADGQKRYAGQVCKVLAGCGNAGERQATDVANAKGNRLQRCRAGNQGSEHSEETGEGAAESIGAGTGSSSRDVAYTASKRQQGSRLYGRPQHQAQNKDGQADRADDSSQRNAQFWLPEPPVGRVVDGLPGRVDRLKGLGNAIVPQVAYEIICQLDRQ